MHCMSTLSHRMFGLWCIEWVHCRTKQVEPFVKRTVRHKVTIFGISRNLIVAQYTCICTFECKCTYKQKYYVHWSTSTCTCTSEHMYMYIEHNSWSHSRASWLRKRWGAGGGALAIPPTAPNNGSLDDCISSADRSASDNSSVDRYTPILSLGLSAGSKWFCGSITAKHQSAHGSIMRRQCTKHAHHCADK